MGGFFFFPRHKPCSTLHSSNCYKSSPKTQTLLYIVLIKMLQIFTKEADTDRVEVCEAVIFKCAAQIY